MNLNPILSVVIRNRKYLNMVLNILSQIKKWNVKMIARRVIISSPNPQQGVQDIGKMVWG